jgi:hypothetical protein
MLCHNYYFGVNGICINVEVWIMPAPPDSKAQKALSYLVGEVLKRTGWKADPVAVRRLMIERLHNAES